LKTLDLGERIKVNVSLLFQCCSLSHSFLWYSSMIIELGNNNLWGTIPNLPIPNPPIPEEGCVAFPNPFSSFMLRMYRKIYTKDNESSLETLSFCKFFWYYWLNAYDINSPHSFNIDNNRLNGQIPSSLFELPKLRFLNLGKNHMTWSITWFLFSKLLFFAN